MDYYSVLYENKEAELSGQSLLSPQIFKDLNLDQIIREILTEKEEYELDPLFNHNLKTAEAINYRLEIMKDLENEALFNHLTDFSYTMKKYREYAGYSKQLHNELQRQKWLLDAAVVYLDAVIGLNQAMESAFCASKGLMLFKSWLASYVNSHSFRLLSEETYRLKEDFDKIKFSLEFTNDIITVTQESNNSDYCAKINQTFENINKTKFDYSINFFTDLEMNSLETRIYGIIRSQNAHLFDKLQAYARKHPMLLEEKIKAFDRDIQFYISYLQFINKIRNKGFTFSYPTVSNNKDVKITEGYDLALAFKTDKSKADIVNNDIVLENEERISLLTGPNQGGKTTFARTFGQILYLASIGCPVPCRKAQLFIFDNIFTHFAVEENLDTNAGRLQEELIRIKEILAHATSKSVVIINELFATTTSYDAYLMGKRVLDHFLAIDCICLYVTHIHELTKISKKIVSLIAVVNSDEKATRTYKVVRKPSDGMAYTNSLVEKYDLTYQKVKERIKK